MKSGYNSRSEQRAYRFEEVVMKLRWNTAISCIDLEAMTFQNSALASLVRSVLEHTEKLIAVERLYGVVGREHPMGDSFC